jgi:mono/diheme cytochrome c family protein
MRALPLLVLLLACDAALAATRVERGGAEGRVLYTRYCGACHGIGADGHGPVAPVLRESPADLRRLSQRYGSPLDADAVARFVDGREAVAAHGPREMPIWGERFAAPEHAVDRRIRAIVQYLDTIQGRMPER